MNIQTIMVVGAGQMGSGIVQVAAASGLRVLLHDISMAVIDKGLASIDKQLSRGVEKGGLTEVRKAEIQSRGVASVESVDTGFYSYHG